MSGVKDFRYLIPESLFKEITQKTTENYPQICHEWLFADCKENLGICTQFIMNPNLRKTKVHIKPRNLMRYKKSKIYNIRKFEQELGSTI